MADQSTTGRMRVVDRDGAVPFDRLIDALGTHVLDIAVGDPGAGGGITGWTIYDPYDETPLPPRSVVLGVGLVDPVKILSVVDDLTRAGAAALVIRSGVQFDDAVRDRIKSSPVVLLCLADGSSWHQLSSSLRRELDGLTREHVSHPGAFSGIPDNDLFSLANAICALLDAPITIEDRSSRVLAFSDHQDEADPARIATVLGRQTPELYTRADEERGVMRLLRASDRPLFIEPGAAEDARTALPRSAIAIRAGEELLGFIWAVVREPLSPERAELMVEASKFAALQLLELRSGLESNHRTLSRLMTSVFAGQAAPPDAIARLGLADGPCVVVALGDVRGASTYASGGAFGGNAAELARRNAERKRIANAFAVHLAAFRHGSVVAEVGDQIYAIVPVPSGEKSVNAIVRSCQQFLASMGRGLRASVGIGSVVKRIEDVPSSKSEVDRTLRVLRMWQREGVVARTGDVDDAAWILDLRDLVEASGKKPSGAFARLVRYDDAKGGASMVATLDAWLRAHGDVPSAAAKLHVHENTLRYRLRRISEIGQVDLSDADSRFTLSLQIRLFGCKPG